MKIKEITLKASNNGRDITVITGYYFDEDNGIHDVDEEKGVYSDLDELLDAMDEMATEITSAVYECDTMNYTDDNGDFVRSYYMDV